MLNDPAVLTSHILGHLLSQFLDFFLKLPQQGILGILVDPYIILDVLGTVRILQSGKSFIIVVARRTDIRNHDSLCITSQGILQQSGKLRITIRDMLRLGVHQALNDQTKSGKGEIDVDGLLSLDAGHTSLILSFATCQIHQV